MSSASTKRSNRRPVIAGNWKMNGLRADGVARARELVVHLAEAGEIACDVVLCPPATILAAVYGAIRGTPIALGGQDCHPEDCGAHTGDIGAPMLADIGCRYVIVGHSERRAAHGETDAVVKAKAVAAQRAGLTVIVCVGESEAERESGKALATVEAQLAGSLPDAIAPTDTIVAYEPIWAIGSGRTPKESQIREVHGRIRKHLRARAGRRGGQVRILYGGSVKPDNAAAILALADVDGALVGGASLDADAFWSICLATP